MNGAHPSEPIEAGSIELGSTRSVHWGIGSIHQLARLLEGHDADRVLLLTTGSLVRQSAVLAQVSAACGARLVAQVDDLPAHVPVGAVEAATSRAAEHRADAVVSLGGGSVIDAAKAVVARCTDRGAKLIHIAIPTTLSGAEFAGHYGITETVDGARVKRTHAHRSAAPVAVILDGALTVATPRWLWAASAIKALDHAIEGLLGSPPRPVVDELAQLGIRQLAAHIGPSLLPTDVAARQACQLAAWRCYFAPDGASLGLSHRIGHVLGGTYGVPHSVTSAVTLPGVLRARTAQLPDRVALVARALRVGAALDLNGPVDDDPETAAILLTELICELALPARLRDVGIARPDVPTITAQVQERFPVEVGQLGPSAAERLERLINGLW